MDPFTVRTNWVAPLPALPYLGAFGLAEHLPHQFPGPNLTRGQPGVPECLRGPDAHVLEPRVRRVGLEALVGDRERLA